MQHQPILVLTGFGINDVQIMAGTFDDFSFDEVVQVLSLSRQCLRLLIRQGEGAISEILLKAGQVLEARMPLSSDPENVFKALFGSAVRELGLSFSVYHTEPSGPFPIPKCRLNEVYGRAKTAGQGVAASGRVAQPAQAFADPEPTVRLQDRPSPGLPAQAALGAVTLHSSPIQLPASTVPDGIGRAVAEEVLPALRQDIAAVLGQVETQAKFLNTLDGRLQVLPQLVAAEMCAALAQHERQLAGTVPRSETLVDKSQKTLTTVLTVGLGVLLLAVVALMIKVFR